MAAHDSSTSVTAWNKEPAASVLSEMRGRMVRDVSYSTGRGAISAEPFASPYDGHACVSKRSSNGLHDRIQPEHFPQCHMHLQQLLHALYTISQIKAKLHWVTYSLSNACRSHLSKSRLQAYKPVHRHDKSHSSSFTATPDEAQSIQ